MWIMLLLALMVGASFLFSGYCISDSRVSELLLKPIYVDKEVQEVVEEEDVSEEDIAALTELAEQDTEELDLSKTDSVSVQDILNH